MGISSLLYVIKTLFTNKSTKVKCAIFKILTQRSSGNVPLSQSNGLSDFTGFLVYSLKTSDKVVRYGENNQVEFSEHPTVVQRGNERTINLLVSTSDVA